MQMWEILFSAQKAEQNVHVYCMLSKFYADAPRKKKDYYIWGKRDTLHI